MYRSLKIRIKPSLEQIALIENQFNAVRYVYNRSLALKQYYYKKFGKPLSIFRISRHITRIKKREPWLQNCYANTLTQALFNLNKAYDYFFKKHARYPQFKSRGGKQSCLYTDGIKLDIPNKLLYLSKIGWIKANFKKLFGGEVRNITLSKTTTNKYIVSVLFKIDSEIQPINNFDQNKVIGLDMGLVDLLTKSNNEKIPTFNLVKEEANIKRKQKKLARKQKGSANRLKAKLQVTKAFAKIANKRNHLQHQLTNDLVKETEVIVIEDLNIKSMIKTPRRAKLITNIGWSDITVKLGYKLAWEGKKLVKIDRHYPSSRVCYNCKSIKEKIKIKERIYSCDVCKYTEDRDVNAAKNIKELGIRILKDEGYLIS